MTLWNRIYEREHHITQVPASQLTHSTASHFKSDEGMGGRVGGRPTSNTKSHNTTTCTTLFWILLSLDISANPESPFSVCELNECNSATTQKLPIWS
jgi:hypothetical protein